MTPKEVIDQAVREHKPSSVFALFSGGHDSLTATAITAEHSAFTAAVHINTGIGIEATREFVRETCDFQGWPLIELHPDGKTYEELVLQDGFPSGPKSHNTMYYWLKQRQIRLLVREHKQGPGDRIMLVTGIRRSESQRRMGAAISVPVRHEGAQLWISPILDWTKADCNRYIEQYPLKRNLVTDLLHRSGECLCGALANRSTEMPELERWFPITANRIKGLERDVLEAGLHDCAWATPSKNLPREQMRLDMPLCVSCVSAGDKP